MADEPISHQTIEDAYKVPESIINRLPSSIESREAKRILEIARDLTYRARERVKESTDE